MTERRGAAHRVAGPEVAADVETVRDSGGPYGERLVPERGRLVREADAELEAERRVPHALSHHPVALLVAACSTIDTEPIFEYTGTVFSTTMPHWSLILHYSIGFTVL